MARRRVHEEEDWEGDEQRDVDPDAPDPSDMDDDDQPDLLPCPHCRRMIDEDTEKCPHCGDWIDPRESPPAPMFWVISVVLFVLMLTGLLWVLMR